MPFTESKQQLEQ